MSSSPATMAASRMMMSYSKASLHHLIRRHLRPTTTATATATATAAANASGSLRALPEFMRFCILQEFAASEVRLGCGVAPIRVGFAFGLEAERLKDESRVEVRGGPIKKDVGVNNSDADDDDDDDGGFDAADYPNCYDSDPDDKFYKNHHTNADHGGYRNW